MPISEICNKNVVFAKRDTTVMDAAKLMREYHVGDLIIADEDDNGRTVPVGVITDRDIVVEALAREADVFNLLVEDLMSQDIVTVKESDGIREAVLKMHAQGVRRIPVVDRWNSLIGVVSSEDLYKLLAEELDQLAQVPLSQQLHEESMRP